MEQANPLIIQVFANIGGFAMLFWLIKRMIERRDTAFDKIVEVVNNILIRQEKTETTQHFHEQRLNNVEQEQKEYRIVKYTK